MRYCATNHQQNLRWNCENPKVTSSIFPLLQNKKRKSSASHKTESNNIIKDKKNVADILNKYFINIAEYTVGRQIAAKIAILEILSRHENHMSIYNIKNTKLNSTFTFEKRTSSVICYLLIFELNARKPIGGSSYYSTKIIKVLNDDICTM